MTTAFRFPVLLALLGASSAFAEARADDLDFYVGKWSCESTFFTGGVATDHAKATADITRTLDGHWINTRMDFMTTEKGQKPTATWEMRGFDAEHKRWVHAAFGNDASGWGLEQSLGFTGNQMVWTELALEGEPVAPPHQRSTIIKVSPKQYRFTSEEQTAKGWVKNFEKVCTRKG